MSARGSLASPDFYSSFRRLHSHGYRRHHSARRRLALPLTESTDRSRNSAHAASAMRSCSKASARRLIVLENLLWHEDEDVDKDDDEDTDGGTADAEFEDEDGYCILANTAARAVACATERSTVACTAFLPTLRSSSFDATVEATTAPSFVMTRRTAESSNATMTLRPAWCFSR